MRHLSLALAAFASTLAAPALAQDATAAPPDTGEAAAPGDSVTLGVALAYLPDYEGSDDYRFVPAPAGIGAVRGFNFTLAGNRLSVDLVPDRGSVDFQLGPIGVVDFNRTSRKSIDDRRVKALGELDTSIELGAYAGIGKTGVITSPYDRLSFSLSYRHDVSSVHGSHVWQPSVNYFTPLSRKTAVGLFASAEKAGRGYARTYFSVSPEGSLASTLPVYDARGGWKNWTLGGLGTVSLTGDLLHGFKLVGGVTYRRMLNDFRRSPLVSIAGSRSQWLGAVGLAYTF